MSLLRAFLGACTDGNQPVTPSAGVGITLGLASIGYTATPGPLFATGNTFGIHGYQVAPNGGDSPYRAPIALQDIDVWINMATFVDGGVNGKLTFFLTKNGAPTTKSIQISAVGNTQLIGPGPIAYVPGDTYGFIVSSSGTVGVFADFSLIARGIPA